VPHARKYFDLKELSMTKNTTSVKDDESGPGPDLLGASTLAGDIVCNADGEAVGEITEIMLDTQTGRIVYAAWSLHSFPNVGRKLLAVPWAMLKLDPHRQRFVLDLEKEKLERAPAFDRSRWPVMVDLNWAAEIHSYYRITPYWQ
jgi:hypothetical protein